MRLRAWVVPGARIAPGVRVRLSAFPWQPSSPWRNRVSLEFCDDEVGITGKPMVTIGYRPILWHAMKYYAHHGHKDFILGLGYRAEETQESGRLGAAIFRKPDSPSLLH